MSVAFAAAILAGTGLLMLPIASTGTPADFITALFTATSATCVTGLVTVDPATAWTPFGQTVILVLIQLGGLGIMTFASLVGIALTRRVSLKARLQANAESRTIDFADARTVLASILRIVVICEATTAVLLYLAFTVGHGLDPVRSIWDAVFHAVSAFNNAGFSSFEGNLVRFVDSPWVNLPIAAAIIVGGLGFPVIVQLLREAGAPRRWRLTTIDIGRLEPGTLFVMDALMFIGAGPAGTAGGIKITVFAVTFAMLIAIIRGDNEVFLFRKRIPHDLVRRAAGIAALAFGLCFVAAAAITSMTGLDLDKVVFEVASAYGTVGLSTGITGHLPPAALLILVALMYIGRLGPLTIAAALVHPTRPVPYGLPEERPNIA